MKRNKLTDEERKERKKLRDIAYREANKEAIAIKRGSCFEGLEVYQGVSFHKGYYKPRIFVDGQLILLGKYVSETRAYKMYKHALLHKHLYEGSVPEFKKNLSFKII